jgi:hypothetical protein
MRRCWASPAGVAPPAAGHDLLPGLPKPPGRERVVWSGNHAGHKTIQVRPTRIVRSQARFRTGVLTKLLVIWQVCVCRSTSLQGTMLWRWRAWRGCRTWRRCNVQHQQGHGAIPDCEALDGKGKVGEYWCDHCDRVQLHMKPLLHSFRCKVCILLLDLYWSAFFVVCRRENLMNTYPGGTLLEQERLGVF